MANTEKNSGEEVNKNIKAGSVKPNPTRYNTAGASGEDDQEDANFDTKNNEPEINPGQINREEIDLDRSGPDNSPKQ